MARPIWSGEISFGLLNIQVELHTAVSQKKVNFHQVDRRDGSRIRYQRTNENTGEEVPWKDIAKSYEYDNGNYILIDKEELDEVRPELTKTIDLEEFVSAADLSVLLFDRPYYLVPAKRSKKAYVLLRETLKEQDKMGIGRVVIRSKQYFVALFPLEEVIVLNTLLYPEELKSLSSFDLPSADDFSDKISDRELKLTEELVKSMSGTWNPEDYTNTYEEALQAWVDKKLSRQRQPNQPKKEKKEQEADVIDIEDLLQKSLKKAQ